MAIKIIKNCSTIPWGEAKAFGEFKSGKAKKNKVEKVYKIMHCTEKMDRENLFPLSKF